MKELALETKKEWQMNNIVNIPMVLSATGFIYIMLNQSINNLNLQPCPISQDRQRRETHCSVSATAHFIPMLQVSSPHTSRHSQRIFCSPTMHRYYITRSSHIKAGLYKLLCTSSFNMYTKLFRCFKFRRYANHPS